MTDHSKAFDNCPGAFYGNMPKPDEGRKWGVITVDITQVIPAIRYLSKRYNLLSTDRPTYGVTSPQGVMIRFELKS